jgi:steroid delta-isomerase-like uncharacterized protein
MALVDELFAPDYVNHVAGSPIEFRGPEGEKQFDAAYSQAFPDARLTVEDMIAEGDRVASRLSYRGTHTGEFQGIPATGKQFMTTGIQIIRIADGKIAEAWSQPDTLGLLQQLGVVPIPELVA